MVFTKIEQNRAFLAIAILYGVWFTTWEWWRLLVVNVQLSTRQPIQINDVIFLQTLSNIFILLGSLIFGQLIDTIGTQITASVIVLTTGILYIVHSNVDTYEGFLWIMPLFMAHQLPLLCETFVATVTEEDRRLPSIMKLRIPLGIAAVIGPCLAVFVFRFTDTTENSQLIAGVVLLACCLPITLCILPEPKPAPQTATKFVSPMPTRGTLLVFLDLLRNGAVWKTLLVQFILDGPYQYYDYLRRQYLVSQYLLNPTDIILLLISVGAVSIVANTCLIQLAQKILPNRQRRLQVFLTLLAINYVLLGKFLYQFYLILVCMPLQMACASIVYADLLTQLTVGVAAVDKRHFSKVISLARFTQLLAAAITPLLAVYLTKEFLFDWWCYVASLASIGVVCLLQVFGGFMSVSHTKLPSYFISY